MNSQIHRAGKRAFLLTLACFMAAGWNAAVEAASPERPNILILLADDLGYADLSYLGRKEDVRTPHLDALAMSAMRFDNSYVTSPICSSSRVALITGNHNLRLGKRWYGAPGLEGSTHPTLAEALKQAGYDTGYVGKFHHDGPGDRPDGRGFPLNHGFDFFYGFQGGTKHYLRHTRRHARRKGQIAEGPMNVQREQVDVEGFTTELFGEQARAFIRAERKNPFFLMLSFNAVHNYIHQLPEAYLTAHGLRGMPDWDPNREGLWEWRARITSPANPEGRAWYLGQLHYLDREVGRVLETLEEQGIADRTVVVFLSDNGGSLATYADNTPLKGGKYTLFEGGIRVPLFIRWPGRTRPGEASSLVSAMDLFPTLCAIAGAPAPERLDGINLKPLLTGEDPNAGHEALYFGANGQDAIRKGRWKLLVTRHAPFPRLQLVETPPGTFLYDLETDPGETTDLAERHPDIVRELSENLGTWKSSL